MIENVEQHKKICKGALVYINAYAPVRFYGRRPYTQEETATWYASDHSKGMTSAGETKLAPRFCSFLLDHSAIFIVLRARCKVQLGWGIPHVKMVLIWDPNTSEKVYVQRVYLTAL